MFKFKRKRQDKRELEKNYKHLDKQWMKDRVIKQMKQTEPLLTGRCSLCGQDHYHQNEALLAVVMEVCDKCARYFSTIQKLKVLKSGWNFKGYYCDSCVNKTFSVHQINPYVCFKCMNRIAKKHNAYKMLMANEEGKRIRRMRRQS